MKPKENEIIIPLGNISPLEAQNITRVVFEYCKEHDLQLNVVDDIDDRLSKHMINNTDNNQ